jgi:hypothetical protein
VAGYGEKFNLDIEIKMWRKGERGQVQGKKLRKIVEKYEAVEKLFWNKDQTLGPPYGTASPHTHKHTHATFWQCTN